MPHEEIQFTEKIIPDAYHGTSRENSERILREGFEKSEGDKQYLGNGIYFFESSKQDAADWAIRVFKDGEVAVIRAIINLGRCLDLHVPEHRDIIRKYGKRLQEEVNRRHNPHTRATLKITDALVINYIANRVQIDTVRAGWVKPQQGKVFTGSHWFYFHQLIICVRNPKNILSIKVV